MTSRFRTKPRDSGYTLTEVVLTVLLVSLFAALSTSVLTDASDAEKFERTRTAMLELRTALLGDNSVDSSGHRKNFGFLGDWGNLPNSLALLTVASTTPAFAYASSFGVGAGWNGPYLKGDFSGVSALSDAWGNALIWTTTADPATVVSRGADNAVGGSQFDGDITMTVPNSSWKGNVYGTVYNGTAVQSGAAVQLRYPVNGVLTAFTTATGAGGDFRFSNVPFGLRSIAVTSPFTISPRTIAVDNSEYVVPSRLLNPDLFGIPSNLVLRYDAALGTGSAFPGAGCGTTTVQDLSSQNIDGTLENFSGCGASSGWNGAGTVSDPYRLTFDGTDDRIDVGTSGTLRFSGDFTVMVWFLRTSNGATQPLFGHGNNSYMFYVSTDHMEYAKVGASDSGATTIQTGVATNRWYHATLVDSGANTLIYINGAERLNTAYSPALAAGGRLYIGHDNGAGTYFQGEIAELEMYDRALSAAEIKQRCLALQPRFIGVTCN